MIPTDQPIYVDANIFIYAMETDGNDGMLARRWLTQIDRGRVPAITSELTAVEVLPRPMSANNVVLIDGYRRLLTSRRTLRIAPLGSNVLVRATALRAELGQETPDAIHVATAIVEGCSGILTNDRRLRLPSGLVRYGLDDVMALHR